MKRLHLYLLLLTGLTMLWSTAGARPIANLELFREASESAADLMPLPAFGTWKTEGFGKEDKDPEMVMTLQAGALRRGDLGRVWLKSGEEEREFEEYRGEWRASLDGLSPPVEGALLAERSGGGLSAKVLCAPKESYLPTRPALEGCFAPLKEASGVREDLRLPGMVILSPEAALGPQSLIFRLTLPATDRRKGFISLFISPYQQTQNDFTAWASVHFRFATEDCVLAPANVIDLGRALAKDGLKVSCSIRGDQLVMRLSSRFFSGGAVPQGVLGQFIAHDGLLAKDSELFDALGPFRLQGP